MPTSILVVNIRIASSTGNYKVIFIVIPNFLTVKNKSSDKNKSNWHDMTRVGHCQMIGLQYVTFYFASQCFHSKTGNNQPMLLKFQDEMINIS